MEIKVNSLDEVTEMPNNLVKQIDLTPPSSTAAASAAVMSAGSNLNLVEHLLASIKELLELRLRSEIQLRHEENYTRQMTIEWMTAAAVIDRICFIVFLVALIIASLVFAILLFLNA